jgi:hypothetical protein
MVLPTLDEGKAGYDKGTRNDDYAVVFGETSYDKSRLIVSATHMFRLDLADEDPLG